MFAIKVDLPKVVIPLLFLLDLVCSIVKLYVFL